MLWIGHKQYEYDYCVYVRSLDDDSFIFLLPYVVDILTDGNHMWCEWVEIIAEQGVRHVGLGSYQENSWDGDLQGPKI